MVALRKESVDRNHVVLVVPSGCWLSLSARRAWIEIYLVRDAKNGGGVALRKESVDRNVIKNRTAFSVKCRSPQGERG